VASDEADLVTFDLVCEGRRRLLGDHAVAPLTSHLLPVRRVAIACLGHWSLRSVQAHAVQTEPPDPKRVMMTSQDGVGYIVEVAVTGLAPVALTRRLSVVTTLVGDLSAVTSWTTDAVWPAAGTDGLNAFGVIEA
jgi:hypothetical protein